MFELSQKWRCNSSSSTDSTSTSSNSNSNNSATVTAAGVASSGSVGSSSGGSSSSGVNVGATCLALCPTEEKLCACTKDNQVLALL
jgi:hypothetical protein